jgi:hypothetical protein
LFCATIGTDIVKKKGVIIGTEFAFAAKNSLDGDHDADGLCDCQNR